MKLIPIYCCPCEALQFPHCSSPTTLIVSRMHWCSLDKLLLSGLGTKIKEIATLTRVNESSLTFEEFHDVLVGHENDLKSQSIYGECDGTDEIVMGDGTGLLVTHVLWIYTQNAATFICQKLCAIHPGPEYREVSLAGECKDGSIHCQYKVHRLTQFLDDPSWLQLAATKRLLRHLKHTVQYGLFLSKSMTLELHGYSDTYWTGDLSDRSQYLPYSIPWHFTVVAEVFLSSSQQPQLHFGEKSHL
ncbi:hypothetical protein Nepgr_024654 [Nepenthes gracilis]|uniref:Uncharacterized protein n=1 Tax=Nepenthes gracilis TaxID=150966 RepID=A0AAD3T559_NEPGR|nr:hypothetical protein Nepgr_024654 [Nepenthes gracilis]